MGAEEGRVLVGAVGSLEKGRCSGKCWGNFAKRWEEKRKGGGEGRVVSGPG